MGMITKHATKGQAKLMAEEFLTEAVARPKFMSLSFWIDANGHMHLKRTTWDWPPERFPEAIAKLRENLELDEPKAIAYDPLPEIDLGGTLFVPPPPAEAATGVDNGVDGDDSDDLPDTDVVGGEEDEVNGPVA